MRFPKRNLWVGVFLTLAILLCAGSAWAQAGSSNIRGIVTDASGATVPKATVTITNLKTNFTRTQTTTENGAFGFELIPPGEYKVEVSAQGFTKKVLSPVQALVGLPVDASVQLAVGSIAEVVQVEATSTAVQVNTQDASLGNNFVAQQITQLPLESRNIQSLLTLQPQVTGSPGATGYVAGARSDQSNVTLDGVDINEAQTNGLSDTVLRLNSEAIEEFRVTTVNANANQGRSSAAQINLVTKSGTNDIRGSLFYYNRSTGFTANNFFNNRATPKVARPALIRNTFAGTVGGPIIKNKLFFFYSYEGRTDASGASVVRQVPLPHLGLGQVRYRDSSGTVRTLTTADLNASFPLSPNNSNVPCNAIPGCTWLTVDPAAVAAMAAAAAAYPSNDNTQGDNLNTGGFRFNAPIRVDNNSNVAKIDWNINSSMTFFARANFIYDLSGQAPAFPDTPSPNTWSHPLGGVVSHNWTIARNWVNNFRYGYTREAFSQQGDSTDVNMSFRFIFSPRLFQRELSRTTPVQNIVDDVSWIKGKHTIQFGTNIRLISNGRVSFGNAFDTALTNPTLYNNSGNTIVPPISTFLANNARPAIVAADQASVRDSASALIGGLSQYTARFTFDASGALLTSGTPSQRTFATQEYDGYILDTWRASRNVTITAGVRYSISRPVYETSGFEVKPDIPADIYLQKRMAAAAKGQIFDTPITLNLSGPANGKSPLYRWDKNNFQPRIAIAWTPNFDSGVLRTIFGSSGQTVFRGGYALTNDYYGEALAVLFDLNNTLGYTSSSNINANTFDTSTALGKPLPPVFTGYNQVIRTLPVISVPTGGISFPRTQPSDQNRRIETGLDEGLQAPVNHVWNFTMERELPKGFVVQLNYTGRLGRHLLAQRDVMALNDLVDPVSGVDFYTAMGQLQTLRASFPQFCIASTSVCGVPYNTVQNIPYFENIFSAAKLGAPLSAFFGSAYAGLSATQTLFRRITRSDKSDTTTTQDLLDFFTGTNYFYNPQYGALSAWGTLGNSNYHGVSLSIRQRLRGLLWDFNYTFSHSLDDASGLQNSGSFGGAAFILNPIKQRFSYAASGFDIRQQVNMNAVYELPFGRGKMFGGGANKALDAVIGGWQLSGIFRWNTGLPVSGPFDNGHWATNWQISSGMMLTRDILPCVTKGTTTVSPKLFGCNQTFVYQSFRSPLPGEIGTRNIIRLPGYVNADMGLSKTIVMPYNEKHKLQLRWEVFNVSNTQRLGGVGGTTAHVIDPLINNSLPPSNWFNLTGIQGSPRVMQIGARFEF